ncbi:GntR family transcriptional regulator [Salinibacillus kushneri]|uniref:GntR family transcriptional regulator n=1 Tax=Salinibacillus kushneri TaxID=237682 RepID=A0A1H9YDC2_9BACI|nr:GntR family transcriptional regulator [Salinibacillus kushneri]SES66942.1 GntR family transcriptional regulator [Salinibacillus kushneri]
MLHLLLDPRSNTPLYEQIIQQVREHIAQGILKPGEKIPSIRSLSKELMINPNTVSKAYKELEKLGIFETYQGYGTYINNRLDQMIGNQEKHHVKEKVKKVVIDSIYAGIQLHEITKWVEEYYKEMGGHRDA